MEIDIYYFSGTGNSFSVAKDIEKKMNGQLISIASVIENESISTDSNVVGIVFPVHYLFNGGVPHIIDRFVSKLHNMDRKYVFAVCTYGNGLGGAIKNLKKTIQLYGGKLSAGFAVKMPYNYTWMNNKLLEIPFDKQQKMFTNSKLKVEFICENVRKKSQGIFESSDKILMILVKYFGINKLGKSIYQKKAGFTKHNDLPFREILPFMDKSFRYNEKCNGCGICAQICPVNNIKMVDHRPFWQNRCEQCVACLHWCPKESIQYGNNMSNCKRYHHPEVTINDILKQKGEL